MWPECTILTTMLQCDSDAAGGDGSGGDDYVPGPGPIHCHINLPTGPICFPFTINFSSPFLLVPVSSPVYHHLFQGPVPHLAR
jgi:hypothetical protein